MVVVDDVIAVNRAIALGAVEIIIAPQAPLSCSEADIDSTIAYDICGRIFIPTLTSLRLCSHRYRDGISLVMMALRTNIWAYNPLLS